METDDRKLYELQEYDNDGGLPEPYQGEVKAREMSTGERIQFVITIIQLVLLALLLVLAIVILYLQLNTSTSSDSAPVTVTSNDNVLTDLANTSTNTQNAVKEVSQIMLAEIERRLNDTEMLKLLIKSTNACTTHFVNTLSNLQGTSTSTAGVVDDILLIAQELLILHNVSTALPTSCKEIKESQPLNPSGFYTLAGPTGTYTTYCNMDSLCGSGGGWTRLAYLDMSDATQNCPSGLRYYQSGGVRVCGRTNSASGCSNSVTYPSNGISYSQICGRVTGYQWGSPNGIDGQNNINANYLDGVSITRGSPRQHVWSLIAEVYPTLCPCASGSSQSVRSFMGNDYFCESGNPSSSSWGNTLYTADPLWDGQGCGGAESPCCNATGIPWFHRDYGSNTTTDYIEFRVCADTSYFDEDIPLSFYEIYLNTNTSSDSGPAPVTSNDNVLTDLANTSTNTQYAVKEVSQIMLAEIERRLNDTTMLNRLAQTAGLTTHSIANVLNAIINVATQANATNVSAILNVATLANATNGAVDSSTQSVLNAIFNVNSVANITNEKLSSLMTAVENILITIGANFAEEREYQFNNTELLNHLLN
uniref:Fibrinogen C-terminal domain-containing protein n=1 Tax=Amphimedon queenslandica TaxID=400682 RepID=A0A1X7UUP4_AMPQE